MKDKPNWMIEAEKATVAAARYSAGNGDDIRFVVSDTLRAFFQKVPLSTTPGTMWQDAENSETLRQLKDAYD